MTLYIIVWNPIQTIYNLDPYWVDQTKQVDFLKVLKGRESGGSSIHSVEPMQQNARRPYVASI